MERGPGREVLRPDVAAAEEEADLLAYELLAPATAVFERTGNPDGDDGRVYVATVLQADFGLPAAAAQQYAHVLLPPRPRDSLLQRLSPNVCRKAHRH